MIYSLYATISSGNLIRVTRSWVEQAHQRPQTNSMSSGVNTVDDETIVQGLILAFNDLDTASPLDYSYTHTMPTTPNPPVACIALPTSLPVIGVYSGTTICQPAQLFWQECTNGISIDCRHCPLKPGDKLTIVCRWNYGILIPDPITAGVIDSNIPEAIGQAYVAPRAAAYAIKSIGTQEAESYVNTILAKQLPKTNMAKSTATPTFYR